MKTSLGTYFIIGAWFTYNLGSAIIDYILIRKLILPETTTGLVIAIILLIGAVVNIVIILKIVYELQHIKNSQNLHSL